MKRFFSIIVATIVFIATGEKFGPSWRNKDSGGYAKRQEKRKKDFDTFGAHDCKICRTRIPANLSYCGACFNKYIKK